MSTPALPGGQHTRALQPRPRCRGQSTVEFALAFPLLVLILVGLLDGGRAVADFVALAQCAREGARAGIYTAATDSQIRDTVRAQAGVLGYVPDADISIAPPFPRASGDNLQVTVRYSFEAATPLLSALWGGGPASMTGIARMRVE